MRPLKDCLEAAADEIDSGSHNHQALQEAATSLEFHLDTIARAKRPPVANPGILPELDKLERRLSSLLVRGWEYTRAFDSGARPDPAALNTFARELRDASRQEIDIVFQTLIATGGEE